MLVQNQKDLRVANRMYGRKLPKVILSWVKLARTADLHARNEKRWRA